MERKVKSARWEMLDYLYEWIRGIAYYMVLLTVLMQAAYGEGFKKYIRLFTGIILILMILAPVARVFGIGGEKFSKSADSEFEQMAQEIERKVQEMEREAFPEMGTRPSPDGDSADGGGQARDGGGVERSGQIEVEEIRIGR